MLRYVTVTLSYHSQLARNTHRCSERLKDTNEPAVLVQSLTTIIVPVDLVQDVWNSNEYEDLLIYVYI